MNSLKSSELELVVAGFIAVEWHMAIVNFQDHGAESGAVEPAATIVVRAFFHVPTACGMAFGFLGFDQAIAHDLIPIVPLFAAILPHDLCSVVRVVQVFDVRAALG